MTLQYQKTSTNRPNRRTKNKIKIFLVGCGIGFGIASVIGTVWALQGASVTSIVIMAAAWILSGGLFIRILLETKP